MKITVEIDDHYIEEDELNNALKVAIKHEVVAHILSETREQTKKAIADTVTATIQASVQQTITETISEFIDTGVITISGKEVAICDHMKNIFQSNHGWNNPHDKMAQLANTFGDDLKKQYNAIFATKIVMNMHAQGFLKDDMAQILLTGSKAG